MHGLNMAMGPMPMAALAAVYGRRRRWMQSLHYGTKPGHFETSKHLLSHEQGSERSERASKRVSAAERASEASSAEQANE